MAVAVTRNRLKPVLRERGLTQGGVARNVLEVREDDLSHWATGAREAPLWVWPKLALALGVPVGAITPEPAEAVA